MVISYTLMCINMVSAIAQSSSDSTKINIAYGKQESWKSSSAISTVYNNDLMKITSASVGNSLKGLLPGLTVQQQSGEPGYDFYMQNMFSRGISSFVGDQKMLVIIDGFEASLDFISQEEIASVSLLKDAAALAVYGARGANGVLLITTKKGQISDPKISLRIQTGVQQAISMPDPIDAYDYARLYNQALINDGLSPRYTHEQLSAYQNGIDPYLYPNVNWKQELLKRKAPLSFAELAFQGGSKDVKYYVMAGFLSNEGLYGGTDPKRKENSNVHYSKFNLRANVDVNVTDNLLASLYSSASVGDLSSPGGDSSASSIIQSIWTTPPSIFPVYNPNGTFGGNSIFTNPVGNLLNRGLYKEDSRALQIIFNLKYDFNRLIKGLCVTTGVGYNNFMAETSSKNRNYARYAISDDGTNSENKPVNKYAQYGIDEPLTATEGFRTDYTRLNFKSQIDYSNTVGKHGIDGMLLFVSDLFKEYGVRDDMKYLNYAGRLTYNYSKKYIAEVSASYMGTDNFSPSKRFGLFPAISAGWVVSNEHFMQNTDWINFLKLRISYGIVGNNQTNARYIFDPTFNSKGSYLFGITSNQTGGFSEVTLANPDVSREKKKIFNIGLDAKLFDNLTLGVDIFKEKQNDILAASYSSVLGLVGASYGGVLPCMNVGKVDNHGFEINIRYDCSLSDDFNYSIGGGVWYAKSNVIEMGEDINAYDYLYHKNNSVWRPITLIAERLYQESDFDDNGKLKDGHPIPQFGSVAPGDIKYIDQNNDNIIDDNDRLPNGYSTVPEWNFALDLRAQWKRVEFSTLFHGVANRDVYLGGPSIYSFVNNGTASHLALDSWSSDNTNASYPRLSTINFNNNYRTSTYWKRNGSYLKLRNIQLGYSLPKLMGKNFALSDIHVYVNATDLFVLGNLIGLGDPEMNSLTNYPLTKSYNVGLKIAF